MNNKKHSLIFSSYEDNSRRKYFFNICDEKIKQNKSFMVASYAEWPVITVEEIKLLLKKYDRNEDELIILSFYPVEIKTNQISLKIYNLSKKELLELFSFTHSVGDYISKFSLYILETVLNKIENDNKKFNLMNILELLKIENLLKINNEIINSQSNEMLNKELEYLNNVFKLYIYYNKKFDNENYNLEDAINNNKIIFFHDLIYDINAIKVINKFLQKFIEFKISKINKSIDYSIFIEGDIEKNIFDVIDKLKQKNVDLNYFVEEDECAIQDIKNNNINTINGINFNDLKNKFENLVFVKKY